MTLLASCGQPPGAADSAAGLRTKLQGGGELVSVPDLGGGSFVSSDSFIGPTDEIPLVGSVQGGLLGFLSPRAVPSRQQPYVFYNAWSESRPENPNLSFSDQGIADGDVLGRPSIRRFGVATSDTAINPTDPIAGRDRLVVDGAFSIAERADGAIAFFRGIDPDYRANQPYLGHITVRPNPEVAADEVQWTTDAGQYVVYGWAGDTLLAYRQDEGEIHDVVGLTGPGTETLFAAGADIIAINPTGEYVLLADQAASGVYLFSVDTGVLVGQADLSDLQYLSGPDVRLPTMAIYGGSWAGDRVAVETDVGIVVVDITNRTWSIDTIFPITPTPFSMGAHEPQLSPDGSTVDAWAPVPVEGGDASGVAYVQIRCDIPLNTCEFGPPQGFRAFSQAYNPSRP
jgi:hypothetical protein